jgi:hypothetical protein
MHAQIFSTVVTRKPVCGITRAMGLAVSVGVVAVAGCAPQLQTQIVGQSTVIASGPSALAADIPVPESQSPQVLRYVVSLPRAVQLRYQITCPTVEREGTIGETFESYRTRRLAELERERQRQANLIGSLVGAVAPPVRASAGAAGPGGAANATAQLDPGAAAADAARASLPPPELPPGDVGATVARGTVELGASGAGRCAVTLATEPAAQDASGAQVFLELVRLVDVEAEERARQAAIRAEQDKKAMALRVWLLGSLQHRGADPLARERARAAARARAEEENRRRQAAADDEARRREAAAAEESRRQREAQTRVDQERWRQEQARLAAEQARLAKQNEAQAKIDREAAARRAAALTIRWQLLLRLQGLGADPLARERARALAQVKIEEENRRRQAAADEANRIRLEAEARSQAERDRLERERLAKEEADRQARSAADHVRVRLEIDARAKVEREAAERRAREWRARQAAFALRWRFVAWLQRQGADPLLRQHQEEARIAARLDEQRRQYEIRARREMEMAVARHAAFDLRFRLVGRLTAMGADPDFRRKRDEAMFREMDAEAKRMASAQAEAAERVRWETQAALDLRVLQKLQLRRLGALDRPTCPPPPVETPPPAPFAGATWIQGRYDWNGIAWIWSSGHYEHPPDVGSVWVPPAQIAVSGTLVVRPGRWVRISLGAPGR